MAGSETDFEIHIGATRREAGPQLRQLRAAARIAGGRAAKAGAKPRQASVRAHFAKGSAGRARPVAMASRRVVVKMRYASNAGGRGAPLRAHVDYLAREGRGQPGRAPPAPDLAPELDRSVEYLSRADIAGDAKFRFYDEANSDVNAKAVTTCWSDDARHFRMILSAEDGEALGDLRPFIREVMAGLEAKLGTKLEWLAVDHHDTDNPHTHVLIRGRRPDGKELFIPSRLISSGIREHAQTIATRILGPRLDRDIVQDRAAEITLRAPTSLDRDLLAAARGGVVWPQRVDLQRRLEHLEGIGLADRPAGVWRLADGLIPKLNAIADADDLERAIAPLRRRGERMPLLAAAPTEALTGELVHIGVADDFGDRLMAVLETGQGELRYAAFEQAADLAVLADIQPGAIVTFQPNVPTVRASDEVVTLIAARTGGLYSPVLHSGQHADVATEVLAANVRRLEAMRRMGLVERRADGVFEVGADHMSTALTFEQRLVKRAPLSAQVVSYWSLEEQIGAAGSTALDQVLSGESTVPSGSGALAHRYEQAVQQRRLFLIEQGWMTDQEQGPSRLAIQRMALAELSAKARDLSGELGLHVLTHTPNHVAGVYARRLDLAQGRMALIVGDRQAALVPWRPALERFAGRQVEGVLRGQSISWKLGRGLGIGLPPM